MLTNKKRHGPAGCAWPLLRAGAVASEAPGEVIKPAHNDITNIASLQRGARNFVNYCMGCHSARYVRYSRLGARTSACRSSRSSRT